MNYKILIVKNRFKGKLALNKYLADWFKAHTPLEITLEEMVTDFDVTTQKVSNGTFAGVICGGDIVDKLRTVIPENKYHAVIFVYGNILNGIRVSVANGANQSGNLYQGTDLIQICKSNDNGKIANHELFHTFFQRLRRFGITLNDNMDTYQNDSDLSVNEVINTNRETALQTLKPYWDKIISFGSDINVATTSPSLAILVRKTTDLKQTLGEMIAINNSKASFYKTLERGVDLRIPTGLYECEMTFSPKFQKMMYLVKVPNMEGIRIHAGNFYSDSEGCILLGKTTSDINKDGELDIASSRIAVDEFELFFNKQPFNLLVL
jgi:hypothetical protein